ncbi:amino acid transport protein [Acinetobacter sp. TY1]|uniref:amino acid transport protein n=1 Tax=unclassified Acinetobacter TaxID=196816 RepID=UPI00304C66FE
MDTTTLLLNVLFSSIGFGYFLYGRKQRKNVPFICGIILMIFPYFIDNLWAVLAIGITLSATPYFVRN